jgi:hypothetical protein
MTCAMCPDEADRFVTTRCGSICFCAGCVTSWWLMLRQPSIFAFYGIS